MKLGLLPLALATGVLIGAGVLVAVVVGADGGGGGSLQGYFDRLSTAQTEINEEYSAISTQYANAFAEKQETLDYLNASADAWGDSTAKLEDIDPPEEAEAAHATLVQATGDVREAFLALSASAEEADDTEEALTALLDTADTTAFDDYGTACADMQTLADSSGVIVQLPC